MGLPQIQGQMCEFASFEIRLAIIGSLTIVTSDFKALSWEHGREGAPVYGTGPYPVGSTGGQYAGAASMEMYYSKSVIFKAALKLAALALNTDMYGVPFDVIGQWTPEGLLVPLVHSVNISGARLLKSSSDTGVGPDPATCVMPLLVISQIEED